MKKPFLICMSVFIVFAFYGCATRQLTSSERNYLDKISEPHELTIFREDQIKDVWGRAQGWIAMYSSMKIQTATDFVIETYNPIGSWPRFGYKIIKEPTRGGYHILIECFSSKAKRNAQILAYYLRTGDMMPQFINR
jgi:hypothetical protein